MSLIAEKLAPPQAPTFVATDASQVGLGASLYQTQNGKEVFIAFASRTLRPHERNYAVNETKALACLWACEYWEKFLIGRPFVLRSDHAALQTFCRSMYTSSRTTAKFYRWMERLAAFDYAVEYRKGYENVVADALSQMPIKHDYAQHDKVWDHNINAVVIKDGITLKRLKQQTAADKLCAQILKHIEKKLACERAPFE